MASNDRIASQATRRPALSPEEAERFASQIRPSWELFGPDGAASAFGADDAAGVAVPPVGSTTPDAVITGVPTVTVAGSNEPVVGPTSPTAVGVAPSAVEPDAAPIQPQLIASIGVATTPAAAMTPALAVADLPLPPRGGEPMLPAPGAPVAPAPPAKTKVGVGGISGAHEAPVRLQDVTRPPVSTPAAASGKAPVSRSRSGSTNPDVPYAPAASEAGDEIELPISGAPKGLLLKIGGAVAALAVIGLGIKLLSGPSPRPQSATPPAVVTATAALAAPPPPPPLDPALADPPKTAAPAQPSATATTAPSAAPTATEKPAAKVEPTPVIAAPKRPPAGGGASPTTGAKPPKKGGGIIRETPF